jgi:alkylation response protein AidB-like acyl-CoA dehydrogenase
MDFAFFDEQTAFSDTVCCWLEAKAPKAWCRAIKLDEESYLYALWDSLQAQCFLGIGVAEEHGGLGGAVLVQMIFTRELSRTAGGLLWVWELTSFGGAKASTAVGSDVLGAMQTFVDKVDEGWVTNSAKMWTTGAKAADRLLVLARCGRWVTKKHHGLTMFFVGARSAGATATLLSKLRMRAMGLCSVHNDDIFVGDADVLGPHGKAWYALLLMLNNETHHGWRTMPRRDRRGTGGYARLYEAAPSFRPQHRRVPGAAALCRGHRDILDRESCGPATTPGCRPRACHAARRPTCSRWSRPKVPCTRSISASRFLGGWAVRWKPTCSVTGATIASFA